MIIINSCKKMNWRNKYDKDHFNSTNNFISAQSVDKLPILKN